MLDTGNTVLHHTGYGENGEKLCTTLWKTQVLPPEALALLLMKKQLDAVSWEKSEMSTTPPLPVDVSSFSAHSPTRDRLLISRVDPPSTSKSRTAPPPSITASSAPCPQTATELTFDMVMVRVNNTSPLHSTSN
ncbi:unnamed protein product [Sphacelaria rigidula]